MHLADVVINLLQRDRIKDAVDWIIESAMLSLEHEMEIEDFLRMDVDDIVLLLGITKQKEFKPPFLPQLYRAGHGWDKVMYGDAAFKSDGE